MTWQDHVSSVVNKVNQRLGVLRRVKQMLPLQSRLTLYNSLILPLFDYGDIVWGDKNNSTLMENLQILQNKAAKIILYRHPHDSASEALDSLGWKPLHLRRRFHRCTPIFKCLNGLIDFDFNFVRNNLVHNYNISNSLTTVFNLSISSGVFPDAWKVAKVTPLFKEGSLLDRSNFRPISVLVIVSKILERHVHSNFYDFLTCHDLLTDFQFGFRWFRSCELAVVNLI